MQQDLARKTQQVKLYKRRNSNNPNTKPTTDTYPHGSSRQEANRQRHVYRVGAREMHEVIGVVIVDRVDDHGLLQACCTAPR